MKRWIQGCLAKAGYRLTHVGRDAAVKRDYVREIEGAYRSFAFKDYPPESPRRLDLMARLMGTSPSEAVYLCYHLHQVLGLEGDVCEFGVAQGRTSALLAHQILPTDKRLWLFDSFEGLPMPTEHDQLKDDIYQLGSMEKYAGAMACKVDLVKAELNSVSFPPERIRIVPGFIEKTIHAPQLPGAVCFAYIDFDFYEPITVALHFLDKVMPRRGVIVVDDYDHFSTGAKKAVDEFVAARKARYEFQLPCPSAGKFCILTKTV